MWKKVLGIIRDKSEYFFFFLSFLMLKYEKWNVYVDNFIFYREFGMGNFSSNFFVTMYIRFRDCSLFILEFEVLAVFIRFSANLN